MKKFMKGCAITALILFLAGAVMAAVAGIMEGPVAIQNVVSAVTHDKVKVNLTDWDDWGITVDEDGLFDADEQSMFDNNREMIASDGEKRLLGAPVSNVEIQVGGGIFMVQPSEDDNMYVQVESAGKVQCYVDGDTLYLKALKKVSDWKNNGGRVTLYLPANAQFDEVKINLGAGILEADAVWADEAILKVGAGRITVERLLVQDCRLEVGAGEIVVNEMDVNSLETEVGMGGAILSGNIHESMDADCSMGSIEMSLAGAQTDYNYDLQAAMGTVSIAGQEYSGLAAEKYMDNQADTDLYIKCAMGDVDISFTGESE